MSSDEKNFNYFVECREDINSRKLIAEVTEVSIWDFTRQYKLLFQLASFFAEQYDDQRIFIITKEKLTKDEAIKFFGELSESKRQRVNFMYCKSYQTVLESLLGMDLQSSIPKVLIIDQLVYFEEFSTLA